MDNNTIGNNVSGTVNGGIPSVAYVLKLVCAVLSGIAGLLMGSYAFFADGVISLSSFAGSRLRQKSVSAFAVGIVVVILGLYAAVASFFETSMLIGYNRSAVNIFILPFVTVVLLLKIVILHFVREAGKESDAGEVRAAAFDLFVTLLVIAGMILSFTADFYYEPAVGMALGLFISFRRIGEAFSLRKSASRTASGN